MAEEFAEQINVDLAFFSSQGYMPQDGIISDTDLRQTAVRKKILKNADQSVFLFEKNRLGQKFLYTLCKVGEDMVVIVGE